MASSNYVIARVDSAAGRQLLRDLDSPGAPRWNSETKRAMTYLGLNDTANALTALEHATDKKHHWQAGSSLADPTFDSIRHSARFRALLQRVKLAP
jgi:hypothetical protein